MNKILVQLSDLAYKKAIISFNDLDKMLEIHITLSRGISSTIFVDNEYEDDGTYLFYIYYNNKLITAGDYTIYNIKQALKIYE